jgi:Flp pilus assembly protein TadB
VLALTLGEAKNIALAVVIGLLLVAVASAWLMKTVMQKVALVVILGLLAVLVWTQRASLDECADKVEAAVRAGSTRVDTSCSFFGRDVQIRTGAS